MQPDARPIDLVTVAHSQGSHLILTVLYEQVVSEVVGTSSLDSL